MSTTPIIQLADAIVADLNAQDWTLEFSAERSYRPTFDLEDLDALRVTVTPAATDSSPLNRDEYERHLAVLIAVQQKAGPEQNDKLDALTDLVNAISLHLEDRKLETMPSVRFEGIESDPLYHPDILEHDRVFLAPMLVKYQLLN